VYKLIIEEKTYHCHPSESVLDALLQQNVNISFACKKGTYHSCMVRSPYNLPPEAAQVGLKKTLKDFNYFLACLCHPEQNMDLGVQFLRHPLTRATWESYAEIRDSVTGFFFDGFESSSMTVLDSIRGLILAMVPTGDGQNHRGKRAGEKNRGIRG
jgi:ferredoxin